MESKKNHSVLFHHDITHFNDYATAPLISWSKANEFKEGPWAAKKLSASIKKTPQLIFRKIEINLYNYVSTTRWVPRYIESPLHFMWAIAGTNTNFQRFLTTDAPRLPQYSTNTLQTLRSLQTHGPHHAYLRSITLPSNAPKQFFNATCSFTSWILEPYSFKTESRICNLESGTCAPNP